MKKVAQSSKEESTPYLGTLPVCARPIWQLCEAHVW